MGMFFVGLLAIMFDRLPPQKVPAASGLSNFLRIVAGGFATSLITTFWDRREAFHQSRLVESVTPYNPTAVQSLLQLHALGLNDQAAAGLIAQGVVGQSYLLSSLDMFYVSGWLALALIPLCWLVPRPAGAANATAGE
jgi:DHA2 family multidrug resistance protein